MVHNSQLHNVLLPIHKSVILRVQRCFQESEQKLHELQKFDCKTRKTPRISRGYPLKEILDGLARQMLYGSLVAYRVLQQRPSMNVR